MESSGLNGSVTYNTFVQQGWQCPICKRVFAPFISECPYCGDNLKCVTTATPDVRERLSWSTCNQQINEKI
jgi:rRNA maturation endonuclease Nob1